MGKEDIAVRTGPGLGIPLAVRKGTRPPHFLLRRLPL